MADGVKPVMKGCTVMVLDDPAAGQRGVLAFNPQGAIYLQTPLATPENVRQMTLADLRVYFDGPARAIDPALSDMIIAELDRMEGSERA